MNRFNGIEAFVRVVQLGSFTAAARSLDMPVTTVSDQVSKLEQRLKVALIHRTTRKLNITELGEIYFQYCLRALDEVLAGELLLVDSKSEPEGRIKITAPPDIGHVILPAIIREYQKKCPKVKVDLLLTSSVVDLVKERVDVALRVGQLQDSSLIAKKFIDVTFHLYASAKYLKKNTAPKSPSDLIRHKFIGVEKRLSMSFHKNSKIESVDVEPQIVAKDFEASKIFVDEGDGLAFLPSFICAKDIKKNKIKKILPDWSLESELTFKVSFVYPHQKFVSKKVQKFIEVAVQSQY